eukprot:1391735-Amorphochlora_amoeboformis.AAC.2
MGPRPKTVTKKLRRRNEVVDPINLPDQDGRTTLVNATLSNIPTLVQLLLESHANINRQDKQGNTALICAAKKGYSKIAEILLDAKADVTLTNRQDQSAFDLCRSARIQSLLAKQTELSSEQEFKALEEKEKFASNCKAEGDKYFNMAITLTDEEVIIESIGEAIRFYKAAMHYEPEDPALRAAWKSAVDFRRRLSIISQRASNRSTQNDSEENTLELTLEGKVQR